MRANSHTHRSSRQSVDGYLVRVWWCVGVWQGGCVAAALSLTFSRRLPGSGWVFNATDCPAPKRDTSYLIDGPQNTWTMLRIVNETHDVAYTEYRQRGSPITRASTNFTELYMLDSDPWQGVNVAESTDTTLFSAALWEIATCADDSCP